MAGTADVNCSADRARPRRDRGTTLVEILVAIVLLGGSVVATLGGLRTSILSGTIHRDHANAHAWLQSAADVLYAREKLDCDAGAPDQGVAAITAAYEATIKLVANPEGWTDSQIQVTAVGLWMAEDKVPAGGDGVIEYRFGDQCHDMINLSLQKITLEVRSPTGRILEEVEVIK